MLRPLVLSLILAGPALADPAIVVSANARHLGTGWTFDVTLSHPETGWDDYADGWRVLGADGTVYGTRELLHPHENEQPFTRSLSGVAVPEGVHEVFVQARTSVEGWGRERFPVELRP